MARDKFTISQSKVKVYRTCRLQYHYKYIKKLEKRKKSRPLKFGSIVHEMLEAKAEGKDPFELLKKIARQEKKLFREEQEFYGDIIQDIKFIMKEYFIHYQNQDWRTIKKNGRRSEHEFNLEIERNLVITGKIDRVVKSGGLMCLVEHKTFGRFPHQDHLWRNLQTSVYFKVLELSGWEPFDAVIWDYIGSRPPTRPQVTKKGTLSKRNIRSLPTVIKSTLIKNGIDPSKHKSLISQAKGNRKDYFRRIITPLSEEVVDTVYDEFIDTAKEIADNHGKSKVRTFGRHCEFCDFESLCRAELTGGDVDFLIERNYNVKKKEKQKEKLIEQDTE